MTKLLLRLFARDAADCRGGAARAACGKLAGVVGMVCNLLLFLAKLVIGMRAGSVSIMADAVNNFSDVSSSVVTLLGFKLAEKPADEGHPYGHARVEYLSGLAIAALILVIGVELARSSFDKILHPRDVELSVALVLVLSISILMKLWLSRFNRTLGNRIASEALLASAADSRNDVISTAAVLISCVIGEASGLRIDGYVGLAVAAFILYSGVRIARDTIDPLLGAAPSPELVERLSREILAYDKVLGIHDFLVHDYGPNRRFASVHVEMDSREDPLDCHDVIDEIERDFKVRHGVDLLIHYDPIVTDDDERNQMHALVKELVRELDGRMSIHDFRMIRGAGHTKLVFDLVVPFALLSGKKELSRRINARIQAADPKCYAVITFDPAAFGK